MEIKLGKHIAELLGEEKLREVGIEWSSRGWRGGDEWNIDLSKLNTKQTEFIRGELEAFDKDNVKGVKVLIRDMDLWKRALGDAGKQRPRTVKQFASLVTEYLRRVPGHRVYEQLEDIDGKTYIAYYVNQVTFHPEEDRGGGYIPARCDVNLLYNEFGGRASHPLSFLASECLGQSASESLARKGYLAETPELREAYLKEADLFNEIAPQIGIQYLARGSGIEDEDRYTHTRKFFAGDKVVIDVFSEFGTKRDTGRESNINQFFWSRSTPVGIKATDGDFNEEDLVTEKGDETEASTVIEVPIHPFVIAFDLRRHSRMKVHVNFLEKYVYDKHMDEKLILPKIMKELVATLIAQSKTGFEDIIEGKGLGVAILLGGSPGTGKTLTAEVFSEASERPLYSIQAAQLGIRSDEVEKNLSRFLIRTSRWNAVALIDEADVYIRGRDTDMEHNAIVASILRVLEYQTSILFMTTNRASIVDDAIISRCIARMDYKAPNEKDQFDIWRVLADLNDIKLESQTIAECVKRHPKLVGRDIKQLLKLAVLHVAKDSKDITPDIIDFVSQFQPTISVGDE